MNRIKGFTLIELLVAMAIIAILAAVVLISMQGYGKDARASKALAEMSSVIPSLYSCWGNGGTVNAPGTYGGINICKLDGVDNPAYGSWPVGFSGDLKEWWLGSWDAPNPLANKNWTAVFVSANDGKNVCCNSAMNGCKILAWDGSTWPAGYCDPTHPDN